MKKNDGSEPISDEPVILTLAFSLEEWAIISASLMSVQIRSQQVSDSTGLPAPVDVARMMRVIDQFNRMVKQEIERLP